MGWLSGLPPTLRQVGIAGKAGRCPIGILHRKTAFVMRQGLRHADFFLGRPHSGFRDSP
jgi:hypothetical protein